MKRRNRGRKAESEQGDRESEILTLHEVADYLHCHYTTVHRLIRKRGLPVFRLGSDFRVRRSDLENWIAQRHVRPEESTASKGPERKVANAKKPARRPKGR